MDPEAANLVAKRTRAFRLHVVASLVAIVSGLAVWAVQNRGILAVACTSSTIAGVAAIIARRPLIRLGGFTVPQRMTEADDREWTRRNANLLGIIELVCGILGFVLLFSGCYRQG